MLKTTKQRFWKEYEKSRFVNVECHDNPAFAAYSLNAYEARIPFKSRANVKVRVLEWEGIYAEEAQRIKGALCGPVQSKLAADGYSKILTDMAVISAPIGGENPSNSLQWFPLYIYDRMISAVNTGDMTYQECYTVLKSFFLNEKAYRLLPLAQQTVWELVDLTFNINEGRRQLVERFSGEWFKSIVGQEDIPMIAAMGITCALIDRNRDADAGYFCDLGVAAKYMTEAEKVIVYWRDEGVNDQWISSQLNKVLAVIKTYPELKGSNVKEIAKSIILQHGVNRSVEYSQIVDELLLHRIYAAIDLGKEGLKPMAFIKMRNSKFQNAFKLVVENVKSSLTNTPPLDRMGSDDAEKLSKRAWDDVTRENLDMQKDAIVQVASIRVKSWLSAIVDIFNRLPPELQRFKTDLVLLCMRMILETGEFGVVTSEPQILANLEVKRKAAELAEKSDALEKASQLNAKRMNDLAYEAERQRQRMVDEQNRAQAAERLAILQNLRGTATTLAQGFMTYTSPLYIPTPVGAYADEPRKGKQPKTLGSGEAKDVGELPVEQLRPGRVIDLDD
jgi:hypothetical protein